MLAPRTKIAFTGVNVAVGIAICISLWLVVLVLHDRFRLSFGGYDSVDGVVLESTVKSSLKYSSGGGQDILYNPIVKYRYKVGSNSYIGNSRDSRHISSSSHERGGHADDVVSKYPPGTKILVWYDTDSPNISIVNIEDKRTLNKFFSSLVFAVFGLLLFFLDRWYRAL